MAFRMRTLGLAALFLMFPLGGLQADETKTETTQVEKKKEESRPVIDETQVYYGSATACKTPATVDVDRVYMNIPEYKKIRDGNLTDKDPNYSILLLKATRKFKAAVESAALEGGQDLVAKSGAVTWEGKTVPDITSTVVRKLEEAAEAAK
jgi:hypothetical protein